MAAQIRALKGEEFERMSGRKRHLVEIAMSGPLIRGTPEWDQRESARAALGCNCLSFGSIPKNWGFVS